MTTAPPLVAPILDATDDALARPLPSALARARADVLAAGTQLLTIPDAALARDWAWIGGSEADVRYGAYWAGELFERAEIEARAEIAGGGGLAAAIVAPATAARWDLHGLLLSLPEPLLDSDPGGDEWNVRLTVGHIINSQRGYGWGSAWWLAHPHQAGDPDLPRIPEEFLAAFPEEVDEAGGSPSELRERLDEILDLCIERFAGLPEDRLMLAARWAGFAVSVAFRLGRWSSHIREHTIQVEKTMAMLGHVPNEAARLARLVLAAYGRAEAVVIGAAPSPAVESAAARIAHAAAEARATINAATTSIAEA